MNSSVPVSFLSRLAKLRTPLLSLKNNCLSMCPHCCPYYTPTTLVRLATLQIMNPITFVKTRSFVRIYFHISSLDLNVLGWERITVTLVVHSWVYVARMKQITGDYPVISRTFKITWWGRPDTAIALTFVVKLTTIRKETRVFWLL